MDVLQALTQRRSCKVYTGECVDSDTLHKILAAGMNAPSGMGKQSAKIVVLQAPEEIAALERMNAAILGNPDLHPFYGAPTVCVVVANADVPTCVEDGSLVMGNLMNAAWSLGVGSCWIHRAREEFSTPEGQALLASWGITGNYIGIGHCLLGFPAKPYATPKPRKDDYLLLR